jgi:hypothetical protein
VEWHGRRGRHPLIRNIAFVLLADHNCNQIKLYDHGLTPQEVSQLVNFVEPNDVPSVHIGM